MQDARAEMVAAPAVDAPAAEVSPAEPRRELADSELYANRELSWLDFNDRVLQLAEDDSLPPMERVKFLAIFVTNLDEFFMIRVAGLHDQIEARIDARGPDGLSPTATFRSVAKMVSEQDRRHARAFEGAVRRRSPNMAFRSSAATSRSLPRIRSTGASRIRSSPSSHPWQLDRGDRSPTSRIFL